MKGGRVRRCSIRAFVNTVLSPYLFGLVLITGTSPLPPVQRPFIPVSQQERSIDTALFEAVRAGKVERVQALLKKGANANANQANGWRPLTTLGGTTEQSLAIAKLLVAHGANVNYRQPGQGWTPLTASLSQGIDPLPVIRFLISKGAKVNLPMEDGTTPLHLATQKGQKAVVRELIAHGANLNARTIELRQPPLDDPDGFFRKSRERERNMRDRSFEPGFRSSGATPAFELALNWDPELVEIYRKAGADFRARDDNGWTILHYAAKYGNAVATRGLLKLGLDPNAASKGGYRPAHIAMRGGYIPPAVGVFEVLKRAGADLQAKNNAGVTPIGLLRADVAAAFAEGGHLQMARSPVKKAYLDHINQALKAMDPQASPMALSTSVVDGRGKRYPNIELFDVVAERQVKVEGDRAVLELTFVKLPRQRTKLVLNDIYLDNYETLTPLPKVVELQGNRRVTARFDFPAVAAKEPGLRFRWNQSTGSAGSGGGEFNESPPPNPTFVRSASGRGGSVSVQSDVSDRTMAFRLTGASYKGKPLKGFPKQEFLLKGVRPVPLVGLKAPSWDGLNLRYRFRLLPNKRWMSGSMPL